MKQHLTHKLFRAFAIVACALLAAIVAVGAVACNKHEHEYIPVEAKEATCTESGNTFYYSCSCGKFFDSDKREVNGSDVLIAAKGHSPVTDEAVPATCTDAGVTEGSHCSVCHTVLTAQQPVNALGHNEVLTEWEKDGDNHWHRCTRCDAKLSFASHTAIDKWIDDALPSCTAEGRRHKECECGQVMHEETLPSVPHNWKVTGAVKHCEKCGASENLYERQDGAIIFGEYPQTKVIDNGIVATLSQMSGKNPEKGAHGKWSDYGYYLNGNVEEYAFYIDLEYDGAKYRGVFFLSVRQPSNDDTTVSTSKNKNGYGCFTLHWFKWEPIRWRILQEENDNIFMMSDIILDSQFFYHERTATRTIDGKTIYPSNYKESDLRAWLNDAFINWAFDEAEKSVIKDSNVDNGRSTTGYGSGTERSQFMCDDTIDKVFLLSVYDAKTFLTSSTRKLKATDYAQCQGVQMSYSGFGAWWLRTANDAFPAGDSPFSERIVSKEGYNTSTFYVNYTDGGVVPAINIPAL